MLPFRELIGMIGSANLVLLVYWSLNVHVCFGGHLIQSCSVTKYTVSLWCFELLQLVIYFNSLKRVMLKLTVNVERWATCLT